jgi:PAS domain-containing protein
MNTTPVPRRAGGILLPVLLILVLPLATGGGGPVHEGGVDRDGVRELSAPAAAAGVEERAPIPGMPVELVEAAVRAAGEAGRSLRERLEALGDRRLRSLLLAPVGFGPELRRFLDSARSQHRLDFLAGVVTAADGAVRVAIPSGDISIRARLEGDRRTVALLGALAGAAARRPGEASFAALPMGILSGGAACVAMDGAASDLDLVVAAAVPLGSGAAILGGLRLSALEREVLGAMEGRTGGSRWGAFVAGPPGPTPGGRAVAGEGFGLPVPPELIAALSASPDGPISWEVSPFCGRWIGLRDAAGNLAGGIGAIAGSPAGGILSGRETSVGHVVPPTCLLLGCGAVAVLGAALLARRRRKAPGRDRREIAWARDELTAGLREAARRFADPALVAPAIERSVERAVGRAGQHLALEIGERIAEGIAARMEMGGPPRPLQAVSAPPSDLSASLTTSFFDGAFPLAIFALDRALRIVAWNPAADRLWGSPPTGRLGTGLDEDSFCGLEGEIRSRAMRAMEGETVDAGDRLSFDRDRVRHVRLVVLPLGKVPAGSGSSGPDPRLSSGEPAAPAAGAIVIAEDVTLKVENEIAAKSLGQYGKALSASLPIPLVVADASNRIMSWNAAAEKLFGIPEGDILGKEDSSLPAPQAPQLALPFLSPEEGVKGTLRIYGPAAEALSPSMSGVPQVPAPP